MSKDIVQQEASQIMMSPELMGQIESFAQIMAKSQLTVPDHLRGKVGDCLAVVMQSAQWGMNPFVVAQKTFQIGGKLGYEAQLVVAVLNTQGPLKAPIDYKFYGDWSKVQGQFEIKTSQKGSKYAAPKWTPFSSIEDGLGVEISGTLKGEDEPRVLRFDLKQAHPRNSTLWATDPQQQICYTGAKRWASRFCPQTLLGVYTREELQDFEEQEKDMGQAEVVEKKPNSPAVEAIKQKAKAQRKEIKQETKKQEVLASKATLTKLRNAIDMADSQADLAFVIDDITKNVSDEGQLAELRTLYKNKMSEIRNARPKQEVKKEQETAA
jgi:hypothetical protein